VPREAEIDAVDANYTKKRLRSLNKLNPGTAVSSIVGGNGEGLGCIYFRCGAMRAD